MRRVGRTCDRAGVGQAVPCEVTYDRMPAPGGRYEGVVVGGSHVANLMRIAPTIVLRNRYGETRMPSDFDQLMSVLAGGLPSPISGQDEATSGPGGRPLPPAPLLTFPADPVESLPILIGSFEVPPETTTFVEAASTGAVIVEDAPREFATVSTAQVEGVAPDILGAGARGGGEVQPPSDLPAPPTAAATLEPEPAPNRLDASTPERGRQEVRPIEETVVAHGLHKSLGSGRDQTPIVRGVSLAVGRGETVFLVGPSGSGKTTLLSMLGCILTPDRGELRVLGRDVSRMRPEELVAFRRESLGFIFQTFNLFPNLSAQDNVCMALLLRGIPRRAAAARAAELLDRVGLGARRRVRPTRLSTGECQRVAIARALAGDPAILLADEPTASLDAENGQEVMRILTGLARDRGLTLLIVTHDNRITPYADRILSLVDGRLAEPESACDLPQTVS